MNRIVTPTLARWIDGLLMLFLILSFVVACGVVVIIISVTNVNVAMFDTRLFMHMTINFMRFLINWLSG